MKILIFIYALSLPALLPRWKHIFLAAGILFAMSIAAFIYLLHDLDANPSGGDGPAFFGLIFIYWLALIAVAASLVGRLIAQNIAHAVTPLTKNRITKFLFIFSLSPAVAASVLAAMHQPEFRLISFAVPLFFPVFWLALALKLAPNNSFKPTPLRGAA